MTKQNCHTKKKSVLSTKNKSELRHSTKRNMVKKGLKVVKTDIGTQSNGVPAMDRARKIQANLSPQFPSFVKLMKRSHVVQGFWLSLDQDFCDANLPIKKSTVTLVDENGEEYETTYLLHGTNSFGLSGGWRGFAIAKRLQVDDAVIFQLVESRKLKVYIIKANTMELDVADRPLNLNSHVEIVDTDTLEMENQENEDPHVKCALMLIDSYDPINDEFDSDTENGSDTSNVLQVLEDVRPPQPDVNFKDVKRFEDFTIQVDALNLDARIPLHQKRKYYELCASQNVFLHENLTKGLNCNLAVGVICETINIADAIKEVKIANKSVSNLKGWDRTLESFEGLGMRVGFLRVRISKLFGVCQKYQAEIDLKQRERDELEDKMRCVEEKLCSIQAMVKKLDLEICDLVADSYELDTKFMEIAGASW